MIYYTLSNNIDGNKLISQIQKLINKYQPHELSTKVLVIKVENVHDHSGDSPIPKITYDPNCIT